LTGLPLATQEFTDEGYADAKPGSNWGVAHSRLGTSVRNTLPQIIENTLAYTWYVNSSLVATLFSNPL